MRRTTEPGPEQKIWSGRSSQVLNLPYLLILAATIGISMVLLQQLAAQPGTSVWVRYYPIAEKSSQVAWGLIAAMVLWRSIVLFAQSYELTNRRLLARSGVLNRHRNETENFRILDLSVTKPFWLRIFGRGNIVLATSDKSHPELKLIAIAQPETVSDCIRETVQRERTRLGVRFGEID